MGECAEVRTEEEKRISQRERSARYKAKHPGRLNRKARERYALDPEKAIAKVIAWRKKPGNLEKHRLTSARWRANNPGADALACARYYRAHKEKAKISKAKWSLENSEKAKDARIIWGFKNPKRIKFLKLSGHFKRSYGVSIEWFNNTFIKQNGVCAICKQPSTKRLHVDHDHETGAVRGLLCHNCNIILGMAKDSELTLGSARRYIKKYSTKEFPHGPSVVRPPVLCE